MFCDDLDQVGVGEVGPQRSDRPPDGVGRAAVDADPGAGAGQPAGDGQADALGGAGDEGGPAGEVDVHDPDDRSPLARRYLKML